MARPTLSPSLVWTLAAVLCAAPRTQDPVTTTPKYDAVTTAVGNGPRGIAAGKFDAGNKPDWVVCNSADNTLTFGFNNGSGTAFTPKTVALTMTDTEPVDCSDGYVANGDGKADDVCVVCRQSNTIACIDNPSAATPVVTSEPAPGGLTGATRVAAGNNADGTPVRVIAYEGNLFSGGGLAAKVGTGPAFVISSPVPKFTDVELADLDGDGVLDVVGQGPGNLLLFKGVVSGSTMSFSPTGSFSSPTQFNAALEVRDVNGDGHRDITEAQNDLFGNPPSVKIFTRFNAGTGALNAGRFTQTLTHDLGSAAIYVTSWRWGDRYAGSIGGHRRYTSAAYCDQGDDTMRVTGLFDQDAKTFQTTEPSDHAVASGCGDKIADYVWDFDGDGTNDVTYVDDVARTVAVQRALPYPNFDSYGTGCGTSTLDGSGSLQLGGTLALRVVADQPRRLAVFTLAGDPANFQLTPSCRSYVGTSGFCAKLAFTNSSNQAVLVLSAPNSTSLLGRDVYGQGIVRRPGGAYFGVLDFTAGVRAKVGDCK